MGTPPPAQTLYRLLHVTSEVAMLGLFSRCKRYALMSSLLVFTVLNRDCVSFI